MSLVWRHHNRRPYFQFTALAKVPGVVHGVFPRFGWDGQGRRIPLGYGSLLGHDVAWENRRAMARAVGADVAVFAKQVHGVRVGVWGAPVSAGAADDAAAHTLADTDALVTDVAGHGLGILVADCQSVMMVDPVCRVVANVHNGWRGSMQNIVGGTVNTMRARYGCRPGDILAAIAPSLGPCCAQYVAYRHDFPQSCWGYRLPDDRFDFWRMSRDQLIDAGVIARNVTQSCICTRCNQHLFYSYRGDRTAGRCATIIGLRT